LILFVSWLSVSETKEGELFAGLLILHVSSILLNWGLKKEKRSLYGIKFRLILTGAMGIIVGIVNVIGFFFIIRYLLFKQDRMPSGDCLQYLNLN
jgi:hypothetical protein